MIPKVINYCWFGKKKLPNNVKKCIESWKKYCPDYKIVRWDESNFDVMENQFSKSAYDLKAWAFVSDYARLKIIYEKGGIYLDTDIELVRPLDPLLDNDFYIGIQQPDGLCNTGLGFGAVKNNIIVKKMLDQYDGLIYRESDKYKIACPYLNDRVIREIGYTNVSTVKHIKGATIYPPRYFDPITVGNTENLLSSDTFSISHSFSSWRPLKYRIRRRIINFIGQKYINILKKFLRKKDLS